MNNTTENLNSTQFERPSVFENGSQLKIITSGILIWIDSQAIITNLVIMIIFFFNKKFRNKSFYILSGNLALSDFFVGLTNLISDGQSLMMQLNNISKSMKTFQCFLLEVSKVFSFKVTLVFNLAVSCDRLFAVQFPIKYKFLNNLLYCVVISSCVWIYSIIDGFMIFSAIGNHGIETTQCNIFVIAPKYADWMIFSSMTWSILAAVVCIVTIFRIRKKLLGGVAPGLEESQNLREVSRSTVTISLIAGSTAFLQIVSRFLLLIFTLTAKEYLVILSYFVRILIILDSSLNFFIYLWRVKEFREVICTEWWKSPIRPIENSVSQQVAIRLDRVT